jgi:hypothetical protein
LLAGCANHARPGELIQQRRRQSRIGRLPVVFAERRLLRIGRLLARPGELSQQRRSDPENHDRASR